MWCPAGIFNNIIFTGTGDWTIFGTHFLVYLNTLHYYLSNTQIIPKLFNSHKLTHSYISYIYIYYYYHILYIKPVLWNVIIENIMSNCISYTHILIILFEIIFCILVYSE